MASRKDPNTLFVRGVAPTVDEAKLEEVFGDLGPVKKVILIKHKGQEKHKGFGFVTFSLREDAAAAADKLNGHELDGKKLLVEIANLKVKDGQKAADAAKPDPAAPAEGHGSDKVVSKAAGSNKQQVDASKYQLRARTVAVGNLSDATAKAVLDAARKAGEVVQVRFPVDDKEQEAGKLKQDGCTGQVALVTYRTVKQALHAVQQLHWQLLPGKTAEDKKAEDNMGSTERVWCRQLGGEGKHTKRWRVIVRNLPFSTAAQALRRIFAKAGFVWDVRVPRKPDGKSRGFAFATFTCKAHAGAAVALLNAVKVGGRPVAVDWAVSKREWTETHDDRGGVGEEPDSASEGGDSDGEGAGSDNDGDDDGGDGASDEDGASDASDGQASTEGSEEGSEDEEGMSTDSDGAVEESDDTVGSEGGDDDTDALGDEEGEEDESGSDGLDVGGEEDDEGRDAARLKGIASAIVQKFSKEGAEGADGKEKTDKKERTGKEKEPVAKSKDKGRKVDPSKEELPRTVFVRGLHLDTKFVALQARLSAFGEVKSCRVVLDKVSGKSKGVAFVDFATPEAAQKAVDASESARAGKGPSITVDGSEVTVVHALTQDGARGLAQQIERKKDAVRHKDKRNLYLAEEGKIEQGTKAWDDMSDGDRLKRQRAEKERKLKLKSPNFMVSPTRLSVRNIPYTWDEKALKAAFVAAVKRRASTAKPVVKQVKILYEEEKRDKDGAPRSKGLGFVEFDSHDHAVCALRELNNNPEAFTRDRRPIVEFAIENVKVLKMREAKLRKSGPGGHRGQAGAEAGGEAAKSKKQAKYEAWKEKRQQKKQELREQKKKGREAGDRPAAAEGGTGGAERAGARDAGAGAGPGSAALAKGKAAKRPEKRGRPGDGTGLAAGGAGDAGAQAHARPGKRAKRDKRDGREQEPNGTVPGGKGRAGDRAASQARQGREERGARDRKRRGEQELERLAGGDDGGAPVRSGGKVRKRNWEEKDSVDMLVEQYSKKLFGMGDKKAARETFRRWFDD